MDKTELAKIMIEYEDTRRRLDKLGDTISSAVLEMGETVVVGNVRATYNNGRKSYNWQKFAYDNGLVPSADHMTVRIDWKSVCDNGDLDLGNAPIEKQSESSVSISVKS